MIHPFYRLTAPSRWVTEVGALSFSSLAALERCPRQWQLLRSSWAGFERLPVRPGGAALEGTLVHEALDRLFRALSLAGMPAVGSAAFRGVMREVDVLGSLRSSLAEAEAGLAEHPRRATLRPTHDALTLFNRVATLFRGAYARAAPRPAISAGARGETGARGSAAAALLRERGALTEWPVRHPTLPVKGVIDLLLRVGDRTRLVDFKTGAPRPEHEEQLRLYALLWWRETGDLPRALALEGTAGTVEFAVDEAGLEALEGALRGRIERARRAVSSAPAPPSMGAHCARCEVRAWCDAYWSRAPPTLTDDTWVDVELAVPDDARPHGFVARVGGRDVSVAWSEAHAPYRPGSRLRALGARVEGGALQLVRSTEVFVRERDAPEER